MTRDDIQMWGFNKYDDRIGLQINWGIFKMEPSQGVKEQEITKVMDH